MTNDIHDKINELFSEEIKNYKNMLLSPDNKSIKKKKKTKEKSSNILTKVEKSIVLNKEEKVKNKKRKSSRLKKKVVEELNPNDIKPKASKEIKSNKKIRDLRTTFMLNTKKKQKDKSNKEIEEIYEFDDSDVEEDSDKNDKNNKNDKNDKNDDDKKKRNISKNHKKQKKSKENKDKQNFNESFEQMNNKKEKNKKQIKKIYSTCHKYNNKDTLSLTDDENEEYSINDNYEYKSIHFNRSNNKLQKCKGRIKKTDTKKKPKLKHFYSNDNKLTLNNNIKRFNKENTLIYYSSEKSSDNQSAKNSINSKSTKCIKMKDENTSIIRVKKTNKKKKFYQKCPEFQISNQVNNFFINSHRENIIMNKYKNIICPGNIISFEYNVSQRKQNDTTRTENNNNNNNNNNNKNNNDNGRINNNNDNINNINNITYKNGLSEINEMEIENNNNESNNNNNESNSKSNNNDKKKAKKKKIFCCL